VIRKKVQRLFRSPIIVLILGIIFLLFVAYPNPKLFIQHIQNLIHPPINPQAVSEISQSLPDDPQIVEEWVFENIKRDANDYANWGVIFYFASPEEVLSIKRGACYARAIVLASILAEKSIPFTLYLMPGHIWVDYARREPYVWGEGLAWIEDPTNAIFGWENGNWRYQGSGWIKVLPAMIGIQLQLYWRIVPPTGKLAIGLFLIFTIGFIAMRIRAKVTG
jgi:hypothetical protein